MSRNDGGPLKPSAGSKPQTSTTSECAALLKRAIGLHQQGRIGDAEPLYLEVLRASPQSFDALHLLGIIKAQQKDNASAADLIGRALAVNPTNAAAHANLAKVLIALERPMDALAHYDHSLAIRPDNAEALNNRGNVLAILKRPEDALASFDRALTIKSDYADAHFNRANVLRSLKRPEDALAGYDRTLALDPRHTEAFNNRSNVLIEMKRAEDALAAIDRALALAPDHVELHYNRGNVLRELKRSEEAIASYDRALAIAPDHLDALINRGNALRDIDRSEEALASFDRALVIKPDHAATLNNRGNALRKLQHPEEALASFDRALAIDAGYTEALNNRGNVLRDLHRLDEALASYERALAMKPDDLELQYNRANALRGLNRLEDAEKAYRSVIERAPEYDFALGNVLDAKLHACEWGEYETLRRKVVDTVGAGRWIDNPFTFLCTSGSAAEQLACARLYSRQKHSTRLRPLWTTERYRHDKIRIAYLSADLREHAVSHLLTGVLERHDRSRFEIIAISFKPKAESKMGSRVANSFDRFIDISGENDAQAARRIRELEIDIAVDLMGYTTDSRTILAHRPAPIHVNYLGYSGTMGAPFIDYIIADPVVIPPDQVANYSEAVVHLPDSYMPTDSARSIAPTTPTRAEAGLPDDAIVFCSFNNPYKLTPPVFDVWMHLLRNVPGSVLWLPAMNAVTSRNLRAEAASRSIDPDRLVFAARTSTNAEHLARLALADLFLDTLPYNAHATTCDALWAGVPVLTCTEGAFAARVAASLLKAVGLSELVTSSLDEYEALALKLTSDRALLRSIRAKLARNRTSAPLFDTDRYRRHLEQAYVTMWERYQRGESPAGFAVSPIAGTERPGG